MKIHNLKNLLVFLIIFALFTFNIAAYANEATLVKIIREQQKENELKEQYLLREKKLEEDPNYVIEQQRKLEERNLRKKQIEENERKQQGIWKLNHIKEYGISCTEKPKDIKCSFLTIQMTQIPLNGYLNKYYAAYNVKIKNNSETSIKIVDLKGLFYNDQNKEISNKINEIIKKRSKKRYPESLVYFWYIPFGTAIWCLFLPALPLIYALSDNDGREFTLGPIYWLGAGIWYTTASPFYYFKDKKNDKVAKSEMDTLLKHIDSNINSSEEVQFNVLSFKRPQLYIRFKKEGENEEIRINY